MVSICLVGAGFMAGTHCQAYDRIADVEVAAVVAPNSAERFVDERDLAAAAFSDLDAALAETDVDAIDVCTPTNTHREYVERAVDEGLPVICEKPLAPSLDDAAAIREAVAETDVPVMVAHVVRFFPQYAAAKERLDAGRIGRPGVARARRLSPFPDWSTWYGDRDVSGGLFVDLAIHDFDYLRWAIGDVERVFARRVREGDLAHGFATLAFENGAKGYVEGSWAQPDSRPFATEFELAGDEGVVGDDGDAEPVRFFGEDDAATENPLGDEGGYVRELRHFVDCVRSGADPAIDVDDAVEALRISVAADRSAERGEPVALSEVQP